MESLPVVAYVMCAGVGVWGGGVLRQIRMLMRWEMGDGRPRL